MKKNNKLNPKNKYSINKTKVALNERIKELTCLYGISEIIEKNISLEEILNKIVNLIPSSWQYPKITCCRILFEDNEYKTKNFKETKWNQRVNIYVKGLSVGSIDIYYLEKKPKNCEGPFLKDERLLINAIAERLGKLIQQKILEKENKELNDRLTDALSNILSGFLPICANCKKIRDEKNIWYKVEEYLSAHSEIMFTHGICPECYEKEINKIKKLTND